MSEKETYTVAGMLEKNCIFCIQRTHIVDYYHNTIDNRSIHNAHGWRGENPFPLGVQHDGEPKVLEFDTEHAAVKWLMGW